MKKRILVGVLALASAALLSTTEAAFAAEVPDALPTVEAVIAVQEAVTEELMATEGILGTAVGLDHQGNLALVVYVNLESTNTAEVVAGMPNSMGDVPVAVQVTEPFRPLLRFKPLDGGTAQKQTPPIQLGTSGGWRYDLANGFCCGGTLGSLVQKGGVRYILSNYHVFESDIVNGGNNRVALPGDPVIQPGLIDVSCNANNAQDVATLSGIKALPTSNVDAAIAQVISGQVQPDGAILDIGTISAATLAASLNQKVKKSGQTTGLTRSTVNGLNATVSVTYDNECAGGTAFTKIFTGQILIRNSNQGQSFISDGDSGSLMVADVSPNPQSVGLLFAGSSTVAVANPIDQVLSFFGATMVGQ
jgi:hypothetical protein